MLMETKKKVSVPSKKETILSLYRSGIKEIELISAISSARPSYVGSVLQREGLIDNYFDLYTSTAQQMNIYSKHFAGKLGFKNVETARRGVVVLESAYGYFDGHQDRAGQHHALDRALTMLDRARWTGKLAEAEVYRQWLVGKLSTPLVEPAKPAAMKFDGGEASEAGEDLEEMRRAA